ncbi:hypothetical protein PHJA_002230800 [Phtheirospermum japonicum]|uniref:Uncharacterized protein n=1 Tax=Phtheirospermum japonicum TaxID=374723 RepID=A0A830CT99_9LAMI|nr:hypothetical protein PHJA_002230800 [Phtheirospermum japonicum]
MLDVPGSSYFRPPKDTQLGQQNDQNTHLPNSQPLKFDVPGSSYLIPPMLDVPGSSYFRPPKDAQLGQQAQIVHLSNYPRVATYGKPLKFDVPDNAYLPPQTASNAQSTSP